MKVLYFIVAVALLTYPLTGISQSRSDLIYKERIANETLQKGYYRAALKEFLLLDSLDKKSTYDYQIGLCYINLQKNQKALPYFIKCLETPNKYSEFLYFYTGKSYHLSHQLDSAIAYYQKFIKEISEEKSKKKLAKNNIIIKQVEREIEMCEYGKVLMINSTPINIRNLGSKINTPYPEYGIVISADENELFFTSTRPGTTGGQIDQSDGMGLYFEDIYKSYKTPDGWSSPVNIGTPVNSSGNDASISLSADGQKLLIYRSAKESFLKHYSGDIYISYLKGNNWTDPVKLPEQINSSGWETGASLSADERVLYFSSNREGGYGGNDLYRVKLLPTGEWAMPQNLGPTINTPYDEDSPFIHPDGKTLYFSSNGHKTMGGLDFFVSTLSETNTEWSKPENLGYPINTAHDDIHLALSADGKKIFFSSDRPEGYGDKDIYYANLEKEEANLVVLKGVITDSTSSTPMEAQITVKDQQTNEVIGVFNSNSESGKYLVVLPEGKNYIFSIEAENYIECNEVINVPNLGGFEVLDKNIKLCSKSK
jgi:tetratricopeptide (TPR) repeat protein